MKRKLQTSLSFVIALQQLNLCLQEANLGAVLLATAGGGELFLAVQAGPDLERGSAFRAFHLLGLRIVEIFLLTVTRHPDILLPLR